MGIGWTVTELPFINGITLINSRDWDGEGERWLNVGEVPRWSDRRRYNNRWSIPAGATGKHYCHPEWFATGQPWPVVGPAVVYCCNGLPACCGVLADCAEGGVEVGGAAGDVSRSSDAAAGGVEVGGAAGDVWGTVDAAAGGVEVGGAAGDVSRSTDATAGGIEVGGSAGDVYTPPTPVPGSTCGTAGAIAPDQSYTGSIAGAETDWFTFIATGGVNYTLLISGVVGGIESCSGFTGSCAVLTPATATFVGNGSASFLNVSDVRAYVLITGIGAGGSYTFTLKSP